MYLNIEENIKSFIAQSDTKLKKTQEKNFVITALLKNNHFYNKDEYIYLLYLKNIESYEIVVCSKKLRYFDICKKEIKNLKGYTLFLFENFFLIFFDKEPFYFQNFDSEITNDELVLYIENKLNISISNKIFIDSYKHKQLLDEFDDSSDSLLKNINETKKNLFRFYLLYLFGILGFVFLYFNFFNEKEVEAKPKIIKKENKFISFYERFEDLKSKLKKYKLDIKTILYEKSSLRLVFLSKDKSNIYSFLMHFKNQISDSSITYDENLKIYECIVDVSKY